MVKTFVYFGLCCACKRKALKNILNSSNLYDAYGGFLMKVVALKVPSYL